MKLGDAGEAFFVQECPEENFPNELATSPIPSFEMMMDDGIRQLHHGLSEEVSNSAFYLLPFTLHHWVIPSENSTNYSTL